MGPENPGLYPVFITICISSLRYLHADASIRQWSAPTFKYCPQGPSSASFLAPIVHYMEYVHLELSRAGSTCPWCFASVARHERRQGQDELVYCELCSFYGLNRCLRLVL